MPPKKNNGCAFGRESRIMIENIVGMFKDFRDNDFAHLEKNVERWGRRPSWLVTAMLIILSNITVGLALAQILVR